MISLNSIGHSIGSFVQQAAEKVVSAVKQQIAQPAPAPQQPVDTFEPSSVTNKPATCGGASTEGAQCLPSWGKNSGGGGGGLGVNPSEK